MKTTNEINLAVGALKHVKTAHLGRVIEKHDIEVIEESARELSFTLTHKHLVGCNETITNLTLRMDIFRRELDRRGGCLACARDIGGICPVCGR